MGAMFIVRARYRYPEQHTAAQLSVGHTACSRGSDHYTAGRRRISLGHGSRCCARCALLPSINAPPAGFAMMVVGPGAWDLFFRK
jgi:hypothetical protein